MAVAGCAGPAPTGSRLDARSVGPPVNGSASVGPSESPGVRPSIGDAGSVPPTGVAPDPSLLDLVPVAKVGATMTYDPETTASVAADPALAKDIASLAIGLVRPAGASPSDADFAIVNVARPRDETAVTPDWFRDWRDTYDAAACAQAGGVNRRSETEVNGLAVFTAACVNGAFTYHALVRDGAIVLSITSVGPGDLGRKIVGNLRR
jgi:hypothetical protein